MEEYIANQKNAILKHLKKYGSIEPHTALSLYGVLRLAARISDLRKDGWNIVTDKMIGKSMITGKPVQFANYKLQ